MLQTETVESATLTILKRLFEIPELKAFHLVGGTALSLLYGHRTSVDLDFFSTQLFENDEIELALSKTFGSSVDIRHSTRFGIFGFIDTVKVDIVRYPHPLIRPIQEIEGMRLYTPEDLIAMKVQAILGRAQKKDFWDIAELLNHYSVADFVKFHKEKYSTQHLLITVPQAITYFTDADESEEPLSLKGQTWKSVKRFISREVKAHLLGRR